MLLNKKSSRSLKWDCGYSTNMIIDQLTICQHGLEQDSSFVLGGIIFKWSNLIWIFLSIFWNIVLEKQNSDQFWSFACNPWDNKKYFDLCVVNCVALELQGWGIIKPWFCGAEENVWLIQPKNQNPQSHL